MTALKFLNNLVQEYLDMGLVTASIHLQAPVDFLKKGQVEDALTSIRRSEELLTREIQLYPQTEKWYRRDLALLHAIKNMIEAGS